MRINCIPPEHLADQHLAAEWVETLMLKPYILRSIKSKNGLILSENTRYTLSTGHARFFYDKLEYVRNRYYAIEKELRKRGVNANPTLDFDGLPEHLFNEWVPTKEDKIKNLNRIIYRISAKPQWYKYYKKNINDWVEFYNNIFDYKWTEAQKE